MQERTDCAAVWQPAKPGCRGSRVIIGIAVLFAASPAAAYRPFDGTDAAVADVGEVEIEFQPVGAMHAGSTTSAISDARA